VKLNEKINYYRRQAKLSQEELAAQVGVSRQAVSKWELGDATPEVDKLLALARAFGVSVDELLREDEPGDPYPPPGEGKETSPPAPGEPCLPQQSRLHTVTMLSIAMCAVGLLLGLGGWLFAGRASYEWVTSMLIAGLVVQVLGLFLFELAAPRMGKARKSARLRFYMAVCWLLSPLLLIEFFWYGFWHSSMIWMDIEVIVLLSIVINGVLTAILAGAARTESETP